jgi:hypothetical protein
MKTDKNQQKVEQPPDLTPADEELLAAIWDKLGKEEPPPYANNPKDDSPPKK